MPALPSVSTAYDIDVWGLGWSRLDVTVERPKLRLRLLVLASQVDHEAVDLRLGVSMPLRRKAAGLAPDALSRVPPSVLAAAVVPALTRAYGRDVSQDYAIWRHKRYLARPALAAGDGPIPAYRRWAEQFYPVGDTALTSVVVEHGVNRRSGYGRTPTAVRSSLFPRGEQARAGGSREPEGGRHGSGRRR